MIFFDIDSSIEKLGSAKHRENDNVLLSYIKWTMSNYAPQKEN